MTEAVERRRLPDTRRSVTHKVVIEGDQGKVSVFLTAGFYEDGRLGEVFVRIGKAGSTMTGLADTVAILLSFALQYGVPLEPLARRLKDASFAPMGATSNPAIPTCTSITDYLFRWLEQVPVGSDGERSDGP